MNRLQNYLNNKVQGVTVFFKSLRGNSSGLVYLFMVLVVPVLLIAFQNCKSTSLDTSLLDSGEGALSDNSYNRGHIIRIDPETDDFIEDQLLPIDTDITMKFINTHEDADTYKWTINRGFDPIVTDASTNKEKYQTQFSEVGAYDVFANSYESDTLLRSASKRFVAGTSCSLNDVLEIELLSGSLKVDGSATFGLRRTGDFSVIKWRARLPSGKEKVLKEDPETLEDINTLELSFEDEGEGDLLIEVSASHIYRSDCLTYRKQNLYVTSALRPHFNPIILTDGSNGIAVMLENNDIYKYSRPSSQYLQVEVLHADTCSYQVNADDETDFTCSFGLVDISLNSETNCSETVINLSASISDSDEEAETRAYYNFCPEDSDYCYFGPTDQRQGYHLCSIEVASSEPDSDSQARSSFERDPANGKCGDNNNECRIGETQDVADTGTHYKWQCLGISGGSTDDCEKLIPIDGACDNSVKDGCTTGEANDSAIADTPTHYTWACEGLHDGSIANDCQIRKPINGVCDNSQRNGCSAGTSNDSAISDTRTHYRWYCDGLHGGTIATDCQRALPPQPVNGACNNNQRNSCTSGNPNDSIVADTSTYYKWHCVGLHGGTTATGCQKTKPINGVCNNSQRNGCIAGTSNDSAIADTNIHYKWYCVGLHGGTTATGCQKTKPINGVCNNSQRNSCTSGNPNDSIVADTSTYYKWHCVGLHGGTTATGCQKTKPINGVCNNSQRNGCTAGTSNDSAIADTNIHYKWHCVGLHGGTTATGCQKAKPINGVCDNSQKEGCSAGTADDSAIADTNTHYTWHCVGLHGGTTITDCQIEKPINGACNNSQRNGCTAGNPSPISDTSTHHRWHCVGLYGGTTATSCQKAIPPDPVNGVCDNSFKNGCSTGSADASAIGDTNTYYKWHCKGLHGGTAATNCQIRKPINGTCNNSQRNGCSTGTADDSAISDTSTYYRWYCKGLHGGTTAKNCQRAIPVNGVCDNSQRNGCTAGTGNDSAIPDTSTYYKWHCAGLHGGTTVANCQIRKPINGTCNNSKRNGCSTGTADDSAISDTSTYYKWHCKGLYGGTTAKNCQRAIPVNGVCDNSQRNGCTAGTGNDSAIPDTSTHYRWHCEGLSGGTTATNCQRAIPVNGVCNNNVKYGCSSGSSNASVISDTGTHYKWHCEGLHGGNTATNCQKAVPINGVCDNSQRNGCTSGTSNDSAADDTSTYYKWYCLGSHGGATATDCQKAKPINGACDNTERNGCSAGTPNDLAADDTATHYVWNCEGLHGGTAATGCKKIRSVNGVCNNNRVNGCRNGTTLEDIEDTDTEYKWKCVGLNGGRTLTCSRSKAKCSSQKYYCEEGSPEDPSEGSPILPVPESGEATHYTWTCVSDDRKVDSSCRQLKQTAWCGGNVSYNETAAQYLVQINTCLVGTAVNIRDEGDRHRWTCDWYRSVALCSAAKHGQCLTSFPWCNSGSKRTSVDEEQGTWTCAGGTSSAGCSK